MSRHANKSALTPQMFRHFAVITIGVTACLGMFTNGEEAERIAKDLDAQQRSAALGVTAAVEKRVTPVAKVNAQFRDARKTHVPLVWDSGDSGSYGQPMDTTPTRGGGGNYGMGEAAALGQLSPNQTVRQGQSISLDQAAVSKPGELPTNRRHPGMQRRPTRQQLDQLQATSAARSGAGVG